jgi:hypothetical protein
VSRPFRPGAGGRWAILVLGYFRARDALEKAVFDQLTTARQTKARQVETYFRTIQAELRLLATSKMVVEAVREFRVAVDELDRAGVPLALRQKVGDWYVEQFIPQMRRVLGKEPDLADYMPVGRPPTISSTTTSSPIRSRLSGASCSTTPATAATTAGCTQSIIR